MVHACDAERGGVQWTVAEADSAETDVSSASSLVYIADGASPIADTEARGKAKEVEEAEEVEGER